MRKRVKQRILKMKESLFFFMLQNGFVLMIPLILTGVTACALMNLPFTGYQEAFSNGRFSMLYDMLYMIYQATFGLFSVALAIALSLGYAMERNEKAEKVAMYVVTSLMIFGTQLGLGTESFRVDLLGVKGCFSAVFSTIIACYAYDFLSKKECLNLAKYTMGMEPTCARAVSAIFPMFLIAAALRFGYRIVYGLSCDECAGDCL